MVSLFVVVVAAAAVLRAWVRSKQAAPAPVANCLHHNCRCLLLLNYLLQPRRQHILPIALRSIIKHAKVGTPANQVKSPRSLSKVTARKHEELRRMMPAPPARECPASRCWRRHQPEPVPASAAYRLINGCSRPKSDPP